MKMSDEYEAMNKKLALRIFNELYDDEDLNELHRKSVIAQPIGFKLSTIAIIECELNAYHDRLTEENAKLRHELANLIYMAESNTGNEPSLSCFHLAIDEAKQLLLNQLKEIGYEDE